MQWGYANNTNNAGSSYFIKINFNVAYTNTDYSLVGGPCGTYVSDQLSNYIASYAETNFEWRTRGMQAVKWLSLGF